MNSQNLIKALKESKTVIAGILPRICDCKEVLLENQQLDSEKIEDGHNHAMAYANNVCSLITMAINNINNLKDVQRRLIEAKEESEKAVIPTGYNIYLFLVSKEVDKICKLEYTQE